MLSAPAASSAATSSPSRAKSTGSTEGTIWIGRVTLRTLPLAVLAEMLPTVVLGVPGLVAVLDAALPVLGGGLARVRAEQVLRVPALGGRNSGPALEVEVPLLCLIHH